MHACAVSRMELFFSSFTWEGAWLAFQDGINEWFTVLQGHHKYAVHFLGWSKLKENIYWQLLFWDNGVLKIFWNDSLDSLWQPYAHPGITHIHEWACKLIALCYMSERSKLITCWSCIPTDGLLRNENESHSHLCWCLGRSNIYH